MPELDYHRQQDIRNTEKLRGILAELPDYVRDFFRGIDTRTSSRTRVAYAYDLKVFYEYLHKNNAFFSSKAVRDITLPDLEALTPVDIEEYVSYLKTYSSPDALQRSNEATALSRKLSALSSFYKYFYRQGRISHNPMPMVDMPKITEKNIIRLDAGEVAELLDNAECGGKLTRNQLYYHEKTKLRDVAILTLFLGTGIRISELVGLNISDIDFRNDNILVTRKGGKMQEVYFSDEVEAALLDYLVEREKIEPLEGHTSALFLSSQKKRISVRAVENLVGKYASTLGTNKHITPHKLRSTYGTTLYQETGDIYLVADVLGHSDVNTTKKHYSAIEDSTRRKARNSVHLRKD